MTTDIRPPHPSDSNDDAVSVNVDKTASSAPTMNGQAQGQPSGPKAGSPVNGQANSQANGQTGGQTNG